MSRWLLLAFLILLALWLRYDPVVKGNLLEADGYYWKNLSEASFNMKLGRETSPLRVAPSGSREDFNLHSFITSHYSLTDFYFYEGILIAVLGVVAYYVGGFLLSSILLFTPLIIARTAIGWNDTDIYICIFSILILHNLYRRRYITAGLFISCLALFWQSWIIFAGIAFAYWVFNDRKIKSVMKLALILVPALICSFSQIQAAFTFAPTVLSHASIHPSGLLTTAELQWSGVEKLKALLSLELIFAIGITYFVALRKKDWFTILAIGCSVLIVTKGERFLLLVVPILGVLIYQYAKKLPSLVLYAFLIGMVVHAIPTKGLHRYLLIMDDTWHNSMQYLASTPKNAVITSWWSPGHIITSESKRSVVLDGGSQHLPRIFWVSRALVSRNLEETRLILCYLASYGDERINQQLAQGKPWLTILQYMADKLFNSKPSDLIPVVKRPTYLLLYKEMILNYPSIKQVAEGFGGLYSLPPVPGMYETVYYRLLTGELDSILPPQYDYSDGKNAIRIWRLN